jgi:hypothetical protein
MSDHVVVAPEGNVERRRHAHAECVAAAHERGAFTTYEEWRRMQPSRSLLDRLLRR